MRRSLGISDSSFCEEIEHALKYVNSRNKSTREANTCQMNRNNLTMVKRRQEQT